MYWLEITDHNDCYFCSFDFSKGINKKKRKSLVYSDFKSAKLPRLFNDNDVKPIPLVSEPSSSSSSSSNEQEQAESANASFIEQNGPILITQQALNDIVRNLDLSKQKSALLGQFLYDHKVLASGCVFSYFRARQENFARYFEEDDSITYCKDIE